MEAIVIALVNGTGFISRAIKWQTRSRYSHAAVVVPHKSPRLCVIEAWHKTGVRRYWPTDEEIRKQMHFYHVYVTEEQAKEVYNFLEKQIGKKYDWKSVFRFVTRKRGIEEDTWFCSELVAAALNYAHVYPFARTQPWEVSPGFLARSPLLRS
jgi:uncharacterized protein YycO